MVPRQPAASVDWVHPWLTDSKWLEARSATLGELSAMCRQPVSVRGDFELSSQGMGWVCRLQHQTSVSVPLICGVVEKFILARIEQGCRDELDDLAECFSKTKWRGGLGPPSDATTLEDSP